MRPAISASESITRTVTEILNNVKTRGDKALREYSDVEGLDVFHCDGHRLFDVITQTITGINDFLFGNL